MQEGFPEDEGSAVLAEVSPVPLQRHRLPAIRPSGQGEGGDKGGWRLQGRGGDNIVTQIGPVSTWQRIWYSAPLRKHEPGQGQNGRMGIPRNPSIGGQGGGGGGSNPAGGRPFLRARLPVPYPCPRGSSPRGGLHPVVMSSNASFMHERAPSSPPPGLKSMSSYVLATQTAVNRVAWGHQELRIPTFSHALRRYQHQHHHHHHQQLKSLVCSIECLPVQEPLTWPVVGIVAMEISALGLRMPRQYAQDPAQVGALMRHSWEAAVGAAPAWTTTLATYPQRRRSSECSC